MKSERQLRLYMVINPVPFNSFEDHEAALFIHLHELVEQSIEQGEDPRAMIEDYLGITCPAGESPEDIAAFLTGTWAMEKAMWDLRDNWANLDPSLPEDSIMYGGLAREDALSIFQEVTLKSYLESLSTILDS
ncbi:hypothetical protein [Fulvivirga kasyanovii]|uniref:Uncharacterized protein n=1 Tax=Fulvivirga kasyanovii TaxID=396812 RepID=A0ABW9RSN0_9BACT|nr:hypothetical protein [Fulvivirga kasyanovii]MTI26298.1 hypothetical protein [Fulvivirga kasyanovii]